MRRAALISAFALIALSTSAIAFAQSDCKTLVKPSPFGPDDQVGATNRITPAVTKAAAAEIQTGDVIPWPTIWSMACLCSAPGSPRRC